MPRKQHTHHFIYKTTCIITNRYYVGMHSTSDINDGYLGSGKRLWYSINKHGRDNHKIEHLEFYPNRESLKARETELVNDDMIKDPMCMNLAIGGCGGIIFTMKDGVLIDSQILRSKAAAKASVLSRKNNPLIAEKIRKAVSENNKRLHKLGIRKAVDWTGKKHKDETRKKIGYKAKERLKIKSNNSQFGTCWIYNSNESLKIKLKDIQSYINQGWIKGRKMKF